ncbi:hypothetical protein ABYF34_05275 [Buchananella felis]|uniref:hypothetical protein n=1 Tax=Buchananella felis TaxID=3231492 RepID=UPI0035286AC3
MSFPAPGQGPQQPMVPQQPQAPAPAFNFGAVMADAKQRWLLLAGAAGVFVALGSFLPWASAKVFGETINVNGVSGEGKFTLILGLMLAVYAGLKVFKPEILKEQWGAPAFIAVAAVSLLITIASMMSIKSEDTFGVISYGYGLWLTFFAAIAAVAFSVLNFLANRGAAPAAGPVPQVPTTPFTAQQPQAPGYPMPGQPVPGQPMPGVAPQQGFPQAPQQPQPPVNPQG